MVDQVEYFGYGANRNPEMMKAILGRIPQGYPATLSGFELCVQTWSEMPQNVQKALTGSWNKKFRSCVVRPVNNSSSKVKGTVWMITRAERKIIDNWELTGQWYKCYVMQFNRPDHKSTQIEIQVVDDPNLHHPIHAQIYRTFLNNKEKMFAVAEKNRKWFLEKGRN